MSAGVEGRAVRDVADILETDEARHLLEAATAHGSLTTDEITSALDELELDAGLIVDFYQALEEMQIDVTGPTVDLHSGSYGGTVENPAFALATILAALKGPDGRVRVPGFYEEVRALTDADRQAFARLPLDENDQPAHLLSRHHAAAPPAAGALRGGRGLGAGASHRLHAR